MPELPEVETVVRDLRPQLLGALINQIQFSAKRLRKPWNASWSDRILGQEIVNINRRGKWIVVGLFDESQLVIHLGMTGQLQVMPKGQPCADHVHMVMDLSKSRQLRFRDIRRFGSVSWFANPIELESFFGRCGLGPEPFELDPKKWITLLGKTSRSLKAILLDQKIVAGVGNIYADESLFQAKLYPGILGKDLKKQGADQLRKAIALVLNRAIKKRGSSIRNYVGGSGLKGRFQNEFSVYGRTGEPCRRCNEKICKIQLAGRSTHFCPDCQKSPADCFIKNPPSKIIRSK